VGAKQRYRTGNIPDSHDRRHEPNDDLLFALLAIGNGAQRICRDTTDLAEAKQLARDITGICERATDAFRTELESSGVRELRRDHLGTTLNVLSAREREIFGYLAEGQIPGEIARRLSRSSKTVHNHRTRILQKLGLRNSADLVRLAVRAGLVSL
jgi:DNA-binding CsgD family transcriptional regulator